MAESFVRLIARLTVIEEGDRVSSRWSRGFKQRVGAGPLATLSKRLIHSFCFSVTDKCTTAANQADVLDWSRLVDLQRSWRRVRSFRDFDTPAPIYISFTTSVGGSAGRPIFEVDLRTLLGTSTPNIHCGRESDHWRRSSTLRRKKLERIFHPRHRLALASLRFWRVCG